MLTNLAIRLQNAAFTAQGLMMAEEETKATVEPFMKVVQPIVSLIDGALVPAILLVTALGAIYCVILGAKFAKAEEPQDQQKAKQALKNAIIGFVLIFVLLSALKVGSVQMAKWYGINL